MPGVIQIMTNLYHLFGGHDLPFNSVTYITIPKKKVTFTQTCQQKTAIQNPNVWGDFQALEGLDVMVYHDIYHI